MILVERSDIYRFMFTFGLAYEIVALSSGGRLPTISALCSRNRWLAAGTVTALVVHLNRSAPTAVVVAVVPAPS